MSAPLILAIQSDRRQASQLASIAKKVSAELVVAESAARAIAVMGERLPDLILTPALLSQKDESAITDRLRESGAEAAHIQTLTIPIFDVSASPARKGVLSSLRKGKRKGKPDAGESLSSTADRFAEEVSVYLTRALEARRARPKHRVASAPDPDPAPAEMTVAVVPPDAVVAAPAEVAVAVAPPDAIVVAPEVAVVVAPVEVTVIVSPPGAVAGAASPEPEPQRTPAAASESDGAHQSGPGVEDGLPTIEELSARTPAVPEPDRSLETGTEAIAAIQSEAVVSDVSALPMPSALPRVAELAMDLSSAQMATAGDAIPAVPEASVSLDVSMDAVAAMVPAGAAPDDDSLATLPMAPQHVAELQVDLPLADAASPGIAAPAPSEPADSVRVGADMVAAIAPVVAAVSRISVAPMPLVPATVAELPLELPNAEALGSGDNILRAVPVPPAHSVETTIDAVAAVAAAASHGGTSPAVPAPAVTPRVAELQVKLPRGEAFAAAHVAVPVMPAPAARMAEINAATMAAIVPLVSGAGQHRPASMPAVVAPVTELAVELPSTEAAIFASQGAVAMPAPPSRAMDAGIEALAGMMPAIASVDDRALSMPMVAARVADLQIQLPSTDASASAHAGVPAAPSLPTAPVEMSMAAIAAMMPFINAAVLARVAPLPAAVPSIPELPTLAVPVPANVPDDGTHLSGIHERPASSPTRYISKAERKRERLQARKAARKPEPRQDAVPSDASFFDPDQCRFSALIAKLDEVVAQPDPRERPSGRSHQGPGGRKGKSSKPA